MSTERDDELRELSSKYYHGHETRRRIEDQIKAYRERADQLTADLEETRAAIMPMVKEMGFPRRLIQFADAVVELTPDGIEVIQTISGGPAALPSPRVAEAVAALKGNVGDVITQEEADSRLSRMIDLPLREAHPENPRPRPPRRPAPPLQAVGLPTGIRTYLKKDQIQRSPDEVEDLGSDDDDEG
jgi:hypothetical protein